MKFLLNVGAEKAGTTWLYEYFRQHPEFHDVGKELNVIQRDDLVPVFPEVSSVFRKDINKYFSYFQRLNKVSGDFTHYEGSSENVFRLIKEGLKRYDIDVVPVYIMRDPISRAWSAWNMLGGGTDFSMPPAAMFITHSYMQCKYKETIEALDNVFPNTMYFFYESFFNQDNLDAICNQLGISNRPAALDAVVNRGRYEGSPPSEFVQKFCMTQKTIEAVDFISKRFAHVPWDVSHYR